MSYQHSSFRAAKGESVYTRTTYLNLCILATINISSIPPDMVHVRGVILSSKPIAYNL